MPMTRRRPSLFRAVESRAGLVLLAAAVAVAAALIAAASVEAASARVAADGDCLNMRSGPALSSAVIDCIGDGTIVTTIPGGVSADGLDWQQVRTSTAVGWVAAQYLVAMPEGTTAAPAPSSPGAPGGPAGPTAFEVPPEGGITFGFAGTSDPGAIVAAQSFPVAGVSAIEPESQRYLTFIPGAPSFVNTLDASTLRADMVVMVRRTGTLVPLDAPAAASTAGAAASTVAGTPAVFATPSRGGLTLGLAGTNDIEALVAAQPFAVDVAMALEVRSQRWLTFIPGAPAWVNSLNTATLRPDTALFIRRSATAPDPPPPPPATTTLRVPITYYYCTQDGASGAGDGGGFCGTMNNGELVHRGAASCDRRNFGQRFRVAGDPGNLVYTCTDTGGGVDAEHRDIWFPTNAEAWTWWRLVAPDGYATIEVLD